MKSILHLGTWNVQTMLLAGKMQEIANQLKIYNIHIAALQETRWPNEGWIDNKDNTLIMVERPTLQEEMVQASY